MADRPQSPASHSQLREIRLIDDRWATVRHTVETVAIVGAGLWAAYVFIYQERIKPAFEPPSLQLSVTFNPGQTIRGVRVAQLHVELANTGDVDTDVYGDTASVFGDRFLAGAASSRTIVGRGSLQINRMVRTSRPELVYAYAHLRDAAPGGQGHIALMPGQHYGFTLPIAVKNGRFDELNATVAIAYGRFNPNRHHFAPITIVRDRSGIVYLKEPRRDAAGAMMDDFSVQTTL